MQVDTVIFISQNKSRGLPTYACPTTYYIMIYTSGLTKSTMQIDSFSCALTMASYGKSENYILFFLSKVNTQAQ